MKNLGENRGITLVALIVTIIILLILAGVTIAILSGEDGILSRTEKAATSYQTESIKEVVNLKLANLNASKWIGEGRKAVLKDLNELDDESSSNFDAEITLKNQVQDNDISAILIYDKHEIEVDSNLNIAKVDGTENIGTTGGSSSSSENGSANDENTGVMDSKEYRQMQATIEQLQQKMNQLETQSTSHATKTELSNANNQITSNREQIENMLTTLDVDTRTTLFEGAANAVGTYNLSDISEYKYIIVYACFNANSRMFKLTPLIENVSEIKFSSDNVYYMGEHTNNSCYSWMCFNFDSATQFRIFDLAVEGRSNAMIYKIEGIK